MPPRIGRTSGDVPTSLTRAERAAVTRLAKRTTAADGRLNASEVREQVAPALERFAPKSEAVAALKEKILSGGGKIDPRAQRALSQLAERFDLTTARAALTPQESKHLAAVKAELAFLQTVWPVKIDPDNYQGEYGLMRSLPEQLGDHEAALLRPIARNIAHAQAVLKSYQTATNLPRDYGQGPAPLNRYDDGFSAALREAVANARAYLPAPVAAQLERVAEAWDLRDAHPGVAALGTPPFHRETEVERLAKLARLKLGEYPDEHLLEAKKAWDSGERTVYFTQENGGSDHQELSVPKRLSSEGDFLRDYVRAASGTFAYWQTL